MKTTRNLIALVIGVMAVFFTACKKDEEALVSFGKPVLGNTFTVEVNGNNVDLNCTMNSATSFLWQISDGSQYSDKSTTAFMPLAGDYTVVLSVSNGGDFVASDTVKFTISKNDANFFSSGIMKALTGGVGAKKTWVLDVDHKFFHNPVDFYGDATAGGATDNVWGPWGGFAISDPEKGEISFDASTGISTLIMDGVTTSGKYGVKIFDRPTDFCTITANNNNGATISLWDHMLANKYNYLKKLSSQMCDLKLPNGVRFPLQIGRITNDGNLTNPSQFLTSDLQNITVMHCTDSSLVIRVKRSYEGDNVNKCWMLYNFIVKEYTYVPETFTYTEPINTAITKNDLVGTWIYDAVAQDWIGWSGLGTKGTVIQSKLLNDWSSRSAMINTLASWGAPTPDVTFTAADANSYIFNADGTCTLAGIPNTYIVSNGKITFGTALTNEFSLVWIGLTGNTVTVAKPEVGTALSGLWLAQQNDAKTEYKAIHIVKK